MCRCPQRHRHWRPLGTGGARSCELSDVDAGDQTLVLEPYVMLTAEPQALENIFVNSLETLYSVSDFST